MPYAVLAAALVALDQLVKYLVSHNIPLGGHVPFLPHLVELTYFQNTGAAFSMLEEHTWLLTLISAVMSVVLGVAVASVWLWQMLRSSLPPPSAAAPSPWSWQARWAI